MNEPKLKSKIKLPYEKKDHLQELLDKFIAVFENADERGVFVKGFEMSGVDLPQNFVNGHRYRGINTFVLGMSGYENQKWMSFNQMVQYNKDNGTDIKLRAGEKGTAIFAYVESNILSKKDYEKIENDFKSGAITQEQYDALQKKSKVMKLAYSTTLFNVSQFDNMPIIEKTFPKTDFEEVRELEIISKSMQEIHGIGIFSHQEDSAYFSPSKKAVFMPPKEGFRSEADYYRTLMHELTHATGHQDLLNRESLDKYHTDIKIRAKEEMIAEFGSYIACKTFGVSYNGQTDTNHIEYVRSWLEALKGSNGKQELQSAFSRASKAVELLEKTKEEYLSKNPHLEYKQEIEIKNVKQSKIEDSKNYSVSM